MQFLWQVAFIVRTEAAFMARVPKLLLSAVVVVFVPALYALVYLSSIWDPEAHTAALPVALVNLDEGTQYKEHSFNIGWEVTTRLEESGRFGFVKYDDEQKARALVREGKMAFALIIPRGFSANAIPGAEAGAGKVVIYTSEGNNYQSAAIARHFSETLGRDINESLNERRWALVLQNAAGSQRSVEALREAATQLSTGAQELGLGSAKTQAGAQVLSRGAKRLGDEVTQLTTGVKQVGTGLKAMDAHRPSNAELNRLSGGAQTLVEGHLELGRGLDELQKGSEQLRNGATVLRDEAKDSLFVSNKALENANQFVDGLTQLDAGLRTTIAAQEKLTDGANRLNSGVESLTLGTRNAGANLHSLVAKLPEDARLDELAKGAVDVSIATTVLADATHKLNQGVQRLAGGIDLLANALPKGPQTIDGSAQGLANSVQPVVEVSAPVVNSGSGFASNVIPGALWLGAGVAAFLIHVRVLPRHAQRFARMAKVMGKIFLPACLTMVQALVVFVTAMYFLKIHILHPWAFALVLEISSMTFLLIVFALVKAFGDAGKGIAMFLLALQLSSSGGILPVELSGGLFAQISPWLPLTWVVKSMKASMFGAYDGAWHLPLLLVAFAGLAAATIATWWGRWRYVKSSALRAPVEL